MTASYIDWLRARLGPRKILLAYVTALMRDDRGRVLMQRRTDFNWWGLPGGVLELGETFARCGVREMREETGLDVEPLRLVGVYAGPQYDVLYPNGDEVQQCTIALECHLVGGQEHPDGCEATELRFFYAHDLPSNCPIWYADMVRDCISGSVQASFEPPESDIVAFADFRSLRACIGKGRVITIGVAAVVQDEAKRVLLTRRGDTGLWGLPAGLMELGETPAGTIVREAYEELQIIIDPVRLAGVFTGKDCFHTFPDGNQVQIITIAFACQWIAGKLRPDGVEALDADFFDPQELPPMFYIHADVLERYLYEPHAALFT